MHPKRTPPALVLGALLACTASACALEKPERTYEVFQFPADKIPRIDGDASGGPLVDKGHTGF